MKVLLIGGSGFVGSELSRRLFERKVEFIIADKRASQHFLDHYVDANITSSQTLDVRGLPISLCTG